MEIKDIIKHIHCYMELQNNAERITQEDMAKSIGISKRAYSEYYRGNNKPLGMKVLLRMLNKLTNDEIIKIVRMWHEYNEVFFYKKLYYNKFEAYTKR